MDNYNDNDLKYDSWNGNRLLSDMAFDGKWEPFFEYVAQTIKTFATTCQSRAYYPHSEADTSAGFPDLYLEPRTDQYPDLKHNYLIEFKYVKEDATAAEIQNKTDEAILQLKKYSKYGLVVQKSQKTTLHCLLVMYKGFDLEKCEEVLSIEI